MCLCAYVQMRQLAELKQSRVLGVQSLQSRKLKRHTSFVVSNEAKQCVGGDMCWDCEVCGMCVCVRVGVSVCVCGYVWLCVYV